MKKPERVLIVGGGFAGVKAALGLQNHPKFHVTLISDDPDLRYYPTLYHTATGADKANSSIPLKTIFAETTNIDIIKAQAELLDRQAKTITTKDKKVYEFDSLIIALGVVTNYYGIPGLDEFSYGIKSQAEVARFKQHLHKQLIDDRRPDLNYVIVGAGPTGIELAGALPGYIKHIMRNHGLADKPVHIDLIEAMPRLLPALPKVSSRYVKRQLKKLGIRLYLGSKVEGETADALAVNGKPISSHTVIWTAGVTNHPFFSQNHFVLMGRGKVAVDTYLQTEPNIFVLGDNANTPFSGMAQTAIGDGAFVADNLIRRSEGKDFKSYVAKKPVSVIPAGPKWAVVIWGGIHFHGILGYLIREAADIRGFHEFEPWSLAAKQYMSEYVYQDDCDICAVALGEQGSPN